MDNHTSIHWTSMTTETLCEVIDAAHLSRYVQPTSFSNRGGLLIIAPPGSFKNAIMEYVLDEYPNALVLADINVNSLMKMREDLLSNRYATMAFPEFAKLYARDGRTSTNIEFTIQLLVDEGFRKPSFADPRMAALKSRLLVMGGMTPTFYELHYDEWKKSGFLRRFINSIFSVENPEIITDAIKQNRLLGLSTLKRRAYDANGIPYSVTAEEANFLHRLLREQPDDKTPLILLLRMFSVLKWKHGRTSTKPRAIIDDFAPTLRRDGGHLVLTAPSRRSR